MEWLTAIEQHGITNVALVVQTLVIGWLIRQILRLTDTRAEDIRATTQVLTEIAAAVKALAYQGRQ